MSSEYRVLAMSCAINSIICVHCAQHVEEYFQVVCVRCKSKILPPKMGTYEVIILIAPNAEIVEVMFKPFTHKSYLTGAQNRVGTGGGGKCHFWTKFKRMAFINPSCPLCAS